MNARDIYFTSSLPVPVLVVGALALSLLLVVAVVGTPTAKQAFEIIDAIWLQDERLAEMRVAG